MLNQLRCSCNKKHHAKGLCINCYKKNEWKPKNKICICCNKIKLHHAKGLCSNCYNKHIKYNISINSFSKCVICGFDLGIEIHHIDCNHNNNNITNLISLCQNHHTLIHSKFNKNICVKLTKILSKTISY